MVPEDLRSLFWDTNLERFNPRDYPVYTVERVLEHGDERGVAWLVANFRRDEIRQILRTSSRLSPRSATFWALVFEVPAEEVTVLHNV